MSRPRFPQLIRLVSRSAARILLLAAPTVASAFSVVPPTFDELVDEAGEIVRGMVESVSPFKTTSANGTPIIKTRVTWRISRSLKGDGGETLTLEFLGGQVGAESLSVSGMPEFHVGDDNYLFVEPDRRVICPLIAVGHGRFSVKTDAATGEPVVYRGNGRRLASTADVVIPFDQSAPDDDAAAAGLTPKAFEREILSTLNPAERDARDDR